MDVDESEWRDLDATATWNKQKHAYDVDSIWLRVIWGEGLERRRG